MKVIFNKPEEVADFVRANEKFKNVQVLVSHGSKIVDGKSLMGLLGYGTGVLLDVKIITDDIDTEESLKVLLKRFVVEA